MFLLGCSVFAAETDKLNVIVIMADDLGYADLSCTGLADDVHTPNIDRLAKMEFALPMLT